MNEKKFGSMLADLRKAGGFTQEAFAVKVGVTAQAVSKWENGHSLPETALLPVIAKLLDCSLDELFSESNLIILEARYGDGLETVNVTKRLSRLVEADSLNIVVADFILGAMGNPDRHPYLLVKYRNPSGIGYAACNEGERLLLTSESPATKLPEKGLIILQGTYGTRSHYYDVMPKIRHYKPFNWEVYHADHERFPSDPANDDAEYLTLVYLNKNGIQAATCAEGESLMYSEEKENLIRQEKGQEVFLAGVPELPSFGKGMECSWGAALTAALKAMGVKTSYDEVMGVSGACYRLAFCSPNWDYSSVDGLVAYDYATPGFAAYGFTPEQYCRIEKPDRAAHRERIMKEIRNSMPVLGINLRVAPEWGVICGYGKEGKDLFCRTKYDRETIENDPEFMKGHPSFDKNSMNPHEYLPVDNWPFLLCYFTNKRQPPSPRENLLASLRIFVDGLAQTHGNGYYMGLKAYEVWAKDLRMEDFFTSCEDDRLERFFSVNQFCTLALHDARKAAYAYLEESRNLLKDEQGNTWESVIQLFSMIASNAQRMQNIIETEEYLTGKKVREFWTAQLRQEQAGLLDKMREYEQQAMHLVEGILASC